MDARSWHSFYLAMSQYPFLGLNSYDFLPSENPSENERVPGRDASHRTHNL